MLVQLDGVITFCPPERRTFALDGMLRLNCRCKRASQKRDCHHDMILLFDDIETSPTLMKPTMHRLADALQVPSALTFGKIL